jgi:hypothetical protein
MPAAAGPLIDTFPTISKTYQTTVTVSRINSYDLPYFLAPA